MTFDDASIPELRADPEGRSEIVAAHDGLAVRLARRFAGKGESLEDLIQVARLGLVNAMDRFEIDGGARFATFATRTIVGELKRHLRDKAWSVRPPRSVQERTLEVNHAVQVLSQRLGRSPTLREIAADIGTDVEAVIEALDAGRGFTAVSVDAPQGSGDNGLRPLDTLGGADTVLQRSAERVTLARLIDDLAERERSILYQRFYEGRSQTEIGNDLGISQMHVSRLLRSTLASLRSRVSEE